MTPVEFRGLLWHQKTRGVPGLSCGVVCVILCLAVLTQYRLVTDGRMDRQTDGHTTIAYIALAQHRAVKTLTYAGLTENGGHENDGPSKLQEMKLECKRIENAVFRYIF